MPAECEKAGGCGVLAVGRCRECGEAYCGSHVAVDGGKAARSLCEPCHRRQLSRIQMDKWRQEEWARREQAEREREQAKREAEERERLDALLYPKEDVFRLARELRPLLVSSPDTKWIDICGFSHYGTSIKGNKVKRYKVVGRGMAIGDYRYLFETESGWTPGRARGVITEHDFEGVPYVRLGEYDSKAGGWRVNRGLPVGSLGPLCGDLKDLIASRRERRG